MREFDKIYLSWRTGIGTSRYIVGVIEKTSEGKFLFKYDQQVVAEAKKKGFSPYTEFPELDKEYNGNVLDIFAQRLIRSERTDIQQFYDFWEIESMHVNDKFYLLGHTQGLSPTDNFEFLADYNPAEGIHFLTDLAGLSVLKLPSHTLKEGDHLRAELEADNIHDKDAVAVYKGDIKVGYIKKIHCRIFHRQPHTKLQLKVKAIEKNGIVKRAFIKIYST
ncbi:MAG: hypothetical protein V4649_03875 [Bacteroidota bacterium]